MVLYILCKKKCCIMFLFVVVVKGGSVVSLYMFIDLGI